MDLKESNKLSEKYLDLKTMSINNIRTARVPEDLSGHDETRGLGTELDVARQEADVSKGGFEVSELLVGQGFDGRGVDGPFKWGKNC